MTTPYKGMFLTNPGGLGGSGVGFVALEYPSLVSVTGSNYDLVSWDPRGVGLSLPATNRTGIPVYIYPKLALNSRSLPKLDFPQMLESDFEADYQITQQEGQACENDLASVHLTTATTVRDMISILDAFAQTEDGKRAFNPLLANYWGFSYGTVLGATFASIFPNRLGHFVLDGVLDPDDYVSRLELRQVLLTDDVLSTFFFYCNKAGPSLCPFCIGSTPEDIYLRLEALVGQLNVTYAKSRGWANASICDFSMSYVAGALFEFTYHPIADFPLLAESLVNLESVVANNLTEKSLISWLIQSLPTSPP
jgi:pimeloyl-ACP methyl ester carboxylesterase